MWLQAGVAKLWGAENPAFLHNNGAGVAGFASHGVAAYSWWASFLHTFVVPNAGWIGITVALAEFSVGVCLALGLFTPIAAIVSLALLFTYAFFAIVILATWRTSSWIGVDGLISGYRQRRRDAHRTTVPTSVIDTHVASPSRNGSSAKPEVVSVA
jgi:thiosulfate dehydrogenase [quinone] large subunit